MTTESVTTSCLHCAYSKFSTLFTFMSCVMIIFIVRNNSGTGMRESGTLMYFLHHPMYARMVRIVTCGGNCTCVARIAAQKSHCARAKTRNSSFSKPLYTPKRVHVYVFEQVVSWNSASSGAHEIAGSNPRMGKAACPSLVLRGGCQGPIAQAARVRITPWSFLATSRCKKHNFIRFKLIKETDF